MKSVQFSISFARRGALSTFYLINVPVSQIQGVEGVEGVRHQLASVDKLSSNNRLMSNKPNPERFYPTFV